MVTPSEFLAAVPDGGSSHAFTGFFMGIRSAQPTPAADCSVRPRPAIIIMNPTNPADAQMQARARSGNDEGRMLKAPTPDRQQHDLEKGDRGEACQSLAAENLRARQRRHLQPHKRAMHALGDETNGERHDAADDSPHDALRERDVESVRRATALAYNRGRRARPVCLDPRSRRVSDRTR
jgi:hypothetical protein